MIIYQVVNEYKCIDEVLAVTLSRSGVNCDNKFFSDIDIDILIKDNIDFERRKKILSKFTDELYTGVGRTGVYDRFFLRNSTTLIEISYISLDKLEKNLIDVVDKCIPNIGYTTYQWRNVINAYIAYDKDNIYKKLQEEYRRPFPEQLKVNIINENYWLLKGGVESYYKKIEDAIKINDIEKIKKNIKGFLESYFDIIFAINEIQHPGEKKILTYVLNNCSKIPEGINEQVNSLIERSVVQDDILEVDNSILEEVDSIIEELDKLIEKEGISNKHINIKKEVVI